MNVRYRWASLGRRARGARLVILKQATSGPLPNHLPPERERGQTLLAFCSADAIRPKETQRLWFLICRGLSPNAAPASLRSLLRPQALTASRRLAGIRIWEQ